MNKLDKFENALKNSLGDYEMPYDASQWARMEKSLGKPAGGNSSAKWLAVASVAVVVGTAALLYYNSESGDTTTTVKNDKGTAVIKQTQDNNTLIIPSSINKEEQKDHAVQVKENNVDNGNVVNNNVNNTPVNNPDPVVVNNNNVNRPDPVTPVNNTPVNNNPLNNNTTIQAPDLSKITPVILSGEEYCVGEKINFTCANTGNKLTGHWEIEGETEITGAGFDYTFKDPGTYTVKLYFTNGNDEKKSPVSEKTIVVKPTPEVAFTWNEVYTDGKPWTVFTNHSSRGQYNWRFKDGSVSNEAEPKLFLRHKGNYPVELTVAGENGCSNTVSQVVMVENEYSLLAPNTFTPNGDALNNTFIPEALKIMDVDFTMNIYDRSGKLVYSTRTTDKPWDGRYTSDNKMAPEGAYVWIVTISGEEPYKGSVTLLNK